MENGVETRTEEGSPQGGNLFPLLANVYLNEFDWEFAERGVPCIRYADDISSSCKEQESSRKTAWNQYEKIYLEETLKLRVNQEKESDGQRVRNPKF